MFGNVCCEKCLTWGCMLHFIPPVKLWKWTIIKKIQINECRKCGHSWKVYVPRKA